MHPIGLNDGDHTDARHSPFIMPTAQGFTYSDGPLPKSWPQHHTAYNEPMVTMIAELHAVVDTTLVPHILTPLSCHKQGLHMRDICWHMLWYDDDGAVEDGVNDIDISRMDPNHGNNDYHP